MMSWFLDSEGSDFQALGGLRIARMAQFASTACFLACFLTEISDVFLVVVFGGTCVGSWEVDFAEGPVAFVQYLE